MYNINHPPRGYAPRFATRAWSSLTDVLKAGGVPDDRAVRRWMGVGAHGWSAPPYDPLSLFLSLSFSLSLTLSM